MEKRKTVEILKDIYADEVDPEDKITAVQEFTEMKSTRCVTKEEVVNVLRWMIEEYI